MKIYLSVIILSYNTKKITQQCISTLIDNLAENKKFITEIIVVDNGSKDGSVENIKSQIANSKKISKKSNFIFKFIENKINLGYPRGNNQALKNANGTYILFLNSDVILENIDFEKLLGYLDANRSVGVLTVKVVLPNGQIDPASHRGFPTIWNSFCYFTRLEKVFSTVTLLNKFFGGYHLTHLNLNTVHEIDSPSGSFYLIRREIINSVGGFDEEFFMYGEDIDLSYRVKKSGYKVIYYPHYLVTHLKSASGMGKKDEKTRARTRIYFYDAMRIFYKKHYRKKYPRLVNKTIYLAINCLKFLSI